MYNAIDPPYCSAKTFSENAITVTARGNQLAAVIRRAGNRHGLQAEQRQWGPKDN